MHQSIRARNAEVEDIPRAKRINSAANRRLPLKLRRCTNGRAQPGRPFQSFFAPDEMLKRVYEVDQPGPQAWKQQRLGEMGLAIPDRLKS